MADLTDLYMRWDAGMSKAKLASVVGMDRHTVRKYLAPAEADPDVCRPPGWDRTQWTARAAGWFPELIDTRSRRTTWSQFDAHASWIREQVAAGVAPSVIFQRLRDEKGVSASVRSLNRWITATITDRPAGKAPRPTALLPPTDPGEVGQLITG